MGRVPSPSLGAFEEAVAERQRALVSASIVARLRERDPSLWGGPADAGRIANRLGWLDAPGMAAAARPEYETFARQVRDAGFRDAVVLGMGGSSLCPEVLRRSFPPAAGSPRLRVLDTTDPASIQNLERDLDPRRTLFLVSTKSGTTIETLSLHRYFRAWLGRAGLDDATAHFVAITDPGTPLDEEARRAGFRAVFPGTPSVGGRYSALTAFGLVPAALLGIDLGTALERAARMAERCRDSGPDNPGLALGAALAGLSLLGRDKVTLFADPPIDSVGLWLEQLLAESLGKQGRGLVPVAGESPGEPSVYADDRLFVHLALAETRAETRSATGAAAALARLAEAGHPVLHLDLAEPLDLFAEFYRWEFATAVAAAVLGVNAFDEPNVSESKENTAAVLGEVEAGGGASPEPVWQSPRVAVLACDPRPRTVGSGRDLLLGWLAGLDRGSYLALQAYLPEDDSIVHILETVRTRLRDRTRLATTLGLGPRYLHSTGQLHKGGPPTGAFLQCTRRESPVVPIPGAVYDFATLQRAQAEGDARSLARHGRPLVRIELATATDLSELLSWLA